MSQTRLLVSSRLKADPTPTNRRKNMRDKPSLKPPPRKNLRGFACHVWGLVNRLVREEFPELAPVEVGLYGPSFMAKDALAQWNEWVLPDGRVLRCISLCAAGARETRPFYLNADDEELRVVLRHELIHGEMKRRGQPWGDRPGGRWPWPGRECSALPARARPTASRPESWPRSTARRRSSSSQRVPER